MGRTNFSYLLIALLIFLVSIPLADDLNLRSALLVRAFIFSCLLLIGVWSLRGGGRFFTIGMVFVVAGVILNALAVNMYSLYFQYGSILSLLGFMFVAIAFTLKQVVVGTDITTNRLVGAICVYLLLGVIWAMIYTLINTVAPGSFSGFSPMEDLDWDSEWLYFSFVTMTTLGYGDILPISAMARSLAYMQAVVGQFYVAILVAGLVGAYVSNKTER